MAKFAILYNDFVFASMYEYMLECNYTSIKDVTEKVWSLDQVEDILVNQYGYQFHGQGLDCKLLPPKKLRALLIS